MDECKRGTHQFEEAYVDDIMREAVIKVMWCKICGTIQIDYYDNDEIIRGKSEIRKPQHLEQPLSYEEPPV